MTSMTSRSCLIPPPQALFRQGHPAHLRAHQEFIATPQAGGHIQRAGLEGPRRRGRGGQQNDGSIDRPRPFAHSFLPEPLQPTKTTLTTRVTHLLGSGAQKEQQRRLLLFNCRIGMQSWRLCLCACVVGRLKVHCVVCNKICHSRPTKRV